MTPLVYFGIYLEAGKVAVDACGPIRLGAWEDPAIAAELRRIAAITSRRVDPKTITIVFKTIDGGADGVALLLDVKADTVREWRKRRHIPKEYVGAFFLLGMFNGRANVALSEF